MSAAVLVLLCFIRPGHSFFSSVAAKRVGLQSRTTPVWGTASGTRHQLQSRCTILQRSGGRSTLRESKGSYDNAATPADASILPPSRLERVADKDLNEVHVFREDVSDSVPRVIECYADRLAVVDGRRYVIGHPCDWVVSLCMPKGGDGVEAVPLDSELMDNILPGLQRELEEDDVHLFNTPVTLTLQGDFLDEDEEEDDDEEGEGDDSDDSAAECIEGDEPEFEVLDEGEGVYEESDYDMEDPVPTDLGDNVGVELIASYWHENQEFSLVKHLEPLFIIARKSGEGCTLLGPEEAAKVKPLIETMMAQELERAKTDEHNRARETI